MKSKLITITTPTTVHFSYIVSFSLHLATKHENYVKSYILARNYYYE